MQIIVTEDSRTLVMNEDGEFTCRHDNVIVEPPCCTTAGSSGYIECACGGQYSVYCPDCENKDLTNQQIEELIDAALA